MHLPRYSMVTLSPYGRIPMRAHECIRPFPCSTAVAWGTSLSTIYTNITTVIGPYPPSVETVNAVHVHGNIQVSGLPPTILTNISRNPKYLENLSKLKSIFYGGGPCPHGVSEMIRKKVCIANVIAATEVGPIALKRCDPEDWEYLTFYSMGGHEFRYVSNGLYERFFVEALWESASETDDVAVNPATKLQDFFEGMLQTRDKPTILNSQCAINFSPTLASVDPIQDGWMEDWMRQWAF